MKQGIRLALNTAQNRHKSLREIEQTSEEMNFGLAIHPKKPRKPIGQRILDLFVGQVKRTKDGGKTFYKENYFQIPWFNGLRIRPKLLFVWWKEGITLTHKDMGGDELTWTWPWLRNKGWGVRKWYSLHTFQHFNSLEAFLQYWTDWTKISSIEASRGSKEERDTFNQPIPEDWDEEC